MTLCIPILKQVSIVFKQCKVTEAWFRQTIELQFKTDDLRLAWSEVDDVAIEFSWFEFVLKINR
jgi:hypothetical protein